MDFFLFVFWIQAAMAAGEFFNFHCMFTSVGTQKWWLKVERLQLTIYSDFIIKISRQKSTETKPAQFGEVLLDTVYSQEKTQDKLAQIAKNITYP